MSKKKETQLNTNAINEKLVIRYSYVQQDLQELENDTTAALNSQYDALAKSTKEGISSMPRLKNAMLEEADLLTRSAENLARLSMKASNQADELRTRVKEAERVEKKQNKKII